MPVVAAATAGGARYPATALVARGGDSLVLLAVVRPNFERAACSISRVRGLTGLGSARYVEVLAEASRLCPSGRPRRFDCLLLARAYRARRSDFGTHGGQCAAGDRG